MFHAIQLNKLLLLPNGENVNLKFDLLKKKTKNSNTSTEYVSIFLRRKVYELKQFTFVGSQDIERKFSVRMIRFYPLNYGILLDDVIIASLTTFGPVTKS